MTSNNHSTPIKEVAKYSRMILEKSNSIDRLVLKKLFIVTLASVPEPTEKQREQALKELEKPFEERCMSQIVGNDNVVKINKQELISLLDIDIEKYTNWYADYYKYFKELIKSSVYEFKSDEEYMTGAFVTSAYTRKNMSYFRVTLDSNFMPIFWNLKGGYVKMLVEDTCTFQSNFTMCLYQFLVQHTNTNTVDFTTKQLKDLFGLSESDYVKKSGKFDRYNFEIKTLEKALKELDQKCKSILILRQQDNEGNIKLYSKTYKKDKKGNETRFVDKYVIKYQVTDPYEIINQEKQNQISHKQMTLDEALEISDEVKNYNWWDEK